MQKCTIIGECNYIGTRAFSTCELLKEFKIPEGITSIEPQTFYNCYALEEVYMPESVTSIGENAFASTKKLNKINFSKNIETMGQAAFYQIAKDTEGIDVYLPNIKSLGQGCFNRSQHKKSRNRF